MGVTRLGGEGKTTKLGGVKFAVLFKAQSNGSNMSMQHHSTLLLPACCTRLATMLHDVALCWMTLNEVWFPSKIIFNIIQEFFLFSSVNKNGHRVQHCWTHACLLSWLCGHVSKAMIHCLYLLHLFRVDVRIRYGEWGKFSVTLRRKYKRSLRK